MEVNRKTKILVIDDEESLRNLLKVSLTYKGFEVITAENGAKGIEIFQQEKPPIVLTDIKMPGIDGLEVLREVRRLDPDTQVIVITGHGDMDSAIESLKFEAADFINKPVKEEVLMVALKRAQEILLMKQKLREYTSNLEVMVKEATEELRKAHDFQENLIQSSIDAIIGVDRAGTVVIFNQAAEKLMAYRSEEVVGRMHITELYHPPELARQIKKKMHDDESGGIGKLEDFEARVVSKYADKVPILLSATLLYKDNQEIGSVGFFQDLRKIKRLQKDLIENERLSAIGQTVSGMAHYMKNILNGLEGGVYMVNTGIKKNKEELFSKGWDMVQNNIVKISELALNMVDYSKEREPELEYCSPNEIAQEIYDLVEERARENKVKLVKDFDLSISKCYLDPNRIHRCLLNLVTNAIDACTLDRKKKTDCSVIIKTQKEDRGIRFDIVDHGIGMTREVQEKLFERFFSTKGSKGSGFGLLVTRKIIEEHGGTIDFESAHGEGTTFTIHLPFENTGEIKSS